MAFSHDIITGALGDCPWCGRDLMPTRRAAYADEHGRLVCLGDEYLHQCRSPHPTELAVFAPFPDAHADLLRRLLDAFPPIEEEAA